jgi:hypothetical protein
MENVIDSIRSTGAQQIISIDTPFVWYLTDVQPVNRNNNITWEAHAYVTKSYNITQWKSLFDQYVQKFVYTFNKPLIAGEFGIDDPSGYVNLTGWQNILPEQVAYLDSKPFAGRWWHTWGELYGEYGDFVYPGFSSTDSDYIIKTVLGGLISGSCQTGETSINQSVCSSGQICCCSRGAQQFQVAIDPSKIIGTNNFSLGFMTDWSWPTFVSDNARRQLVKDANFKLVRVFDFRTTNPRLMPCSNWDMTKNNCTLWNWTQVDSYTQAVFGMGAEPIFTLGYIRDNIQNYIPPGMPLNSTTGLPNSNSYAVYATEWVKHFKQKGWPVRYYEIGNEPFAYFGWNPSPSNNLKLTYYVDFWNFVARAMRQQNPNILLSQDALTQTNVLNYWLQYGDNVDYLDFHKYDCNTWNKSSSSYYNDSEMFRRAESINYETTGDRYGVKDAQQKWLTSRGKLLPVINSESNLNSAWEGGTDPRIQQMTGAVWTALELRQGILKGLQYNVYYEFSSSSKSNPISGGYGF